MAGEFIATKSKQGSRPEAAVDSPRLLVVSRDAGFVAAVRELVAAQMSGAACEPLDDATVRFRPSATALVIDGRADPDAADKFARRMRAMGFAGGIAIVGAPAGAAAAQSDMGIATVPAGRLAHDLVPALAAAIEQAGLPLADQVMRARRLVAAGEIALHLQHDFNNPLAGLLAELQLMQLDPLAPEHAEAVDRMLALVRRLMTMTRGLDGIGERKS
jgi:signal transduction histidine kinase